MFTDGKGTLHWAGIQGDGGRPTSDKTDEKWGLEFHVTQWQAPQVRAKGTWLPDSHPLKVITGSRTLDGASGDAHPPQSLFSASVKWGNDTFTLHKVMPRKERDKDASHLQNFPLCRPAVKQGSQGAGGLGKSAFHWDPFPSTPRLERQPSCWAGEMRVL